LILLAGAFLATVILGVELGILLMLIVSIFILIKYTTVPRLAVLGRIADGHKFKDIRHFPDAVINPVRYSSLRWSVCGIFRIYLILSFDMLVACSV
jgi:MFS superfamily sulfate permease-like transporter